VPVATLLGRFLRLALALLPGALAGLFILMSARNVEEMTFALLAASVALSLAGVAQVALLLRDADRLSRRDAETRRMALALTACMKSLAGRLGALEATTSPGEGLPPGFMAPAANWAAPVAAPVPAPVPHLLERRLLTLPQRRLAGVEIAAGDAGGGDEVALACRLLSAEGRLIDKLRAARQRIETADGAPGVVLVGAERPLADMPLAVGHLAEMAALHPAVAAHLLLGIDQQAVRLGGVTEAAALARLARVGIRFMLTGVTDFRLDPEALAVCRFSHVSVEARRLLAVAGEEGGAARRMAAQLAARGLTLLVTGVDAARQVPELIDLGVALVEGPALSREPPRPIRPVTAAPELSRPAPPPVELGPADRRRFVA
jgi:hypothetical protein